MFGCAQDDPVPGGGGIEGTHAFVGGVGSFVALCVDIFWQEFDLVTGLFLRFGPVPSGRPLRD